MKNSKKILKIGLVKLLVTFIMITTVSSCFGQDTIVARSGQVIIGNVTEVSSTEVKYRRLEMTDGPVYVENKSSIEKIKYKNGYTDVFPEVKQEEIKTTIKKNEEPDYRGEKLPLQARGKKYLYGDKLISENQMHKLLLSLNNPEITKTVNSAKAAKRGQYIGFGAIPMGMIGILAVGLSSVEDNPKESDVRNAGFFFLGTAAVALGTSIHFQIKRKHKNAKALKLYQEKY